MLGTESMNEQLQNWILFQDEYKTRFELEDSYALYGKMSAERPILVRSGDDVLDLRCHSDRKRFIQSLFTDKFASWNIKLMERITRSIGRFPPSPFLDVINCDGKLVANVVCFEYLIHHQAARGMLISAAKDPKSTSKKLIVHAMSMNLISNRLILQFVFQSGRCNLWKPYLAAMIAVLSVNPPVTLYDSIYLGLKVSMRLWSEEQFQFAIDKGLFKCIVALLMYHISVTEQNDLERKVSRVAGLWLMNLVIFFCSNYKIYIPGHETALPRLFWRQSEMALPRLYLPEGHEMTPIWAGNDILSEERVKRNGCGWLRCQLETVMAGETKMAMYRCERCKLIKYCCRNHQKKHWKFIHRQQCRQY